MKAKKTSKRSVKSSTVSIASVRAFLAFLIFALAASIFLLFVTYQQNIMANNMFYPFIILAFVGMGLLIALLFLINPSTPKKK